MYFIVVQESGMNSPINFSKDSVDLTKNSMHIPHTSLFGLSDVR